MAAEAGIQIEFIGKRSFRKEDRVNEILAKRGEHAGLVCIFSAREPCSTYKPWPNKPTGKTYLIPDDGKCLHYYFYFVDEDLGLCHARGFRRGCRAGYRSVSTATTSWRANCASGESIIEGRTTLSPISGTGSGLSASPAEGKRNGYMQGWMSSPGGAARSIGISQADTTGAWISANMPPTLSSASRRTCRPSTRIWRARRFIRSSRTTRLRG